MGSLTPFSIYHKLIWFTSTPTDLRNSTPESSLYNLLKTTLDIPDCKISLLHSLQGESVKYNVAPLELFVDLETFNIALASA